MRRLAPILKTQEGYLIDHDPEDLDSDIIDIWSRIDERDRDQALRVLRSFIPAVLVCMLASAGRNVTAQEVAVRGVPLAEESGWLFRVAKNRIIDLFRKKKPEPLGESEWLSIEELLQKVDQLIGLGDLMTSQAEDSLVAPGPDDFIFGKADFRDGFVVQIAFARDRVEEERGGFGLAAGAFDLIFGEFLGGFEDGLGFAAIGALELVDNFAGEIDGFDGFKSLLGFAP